MLIPVLTMAQTGSKANPDAKGGKGTKSIKETVLETIIIEAEVEKPRVTLLPKRLEPRFGDIEFVDRSFSHELKEKPAEDFLLESSFFLPRKIKPASRLFVKK